MKREVKYRTKTHAIVHQFESSLRVRFGQVAEKYGFKQDKKIMGVDTSSVYFRKDNTFFMIALNAHARDGQPFTQLMLGYGPWEETEWNAVPLSRYVWINQRDELPMEYKVRDFETIDHCVIRMAQDLVGHASDFLEGETLPLIKVISKYAENREPFRLFRPDGKGGYVGEADPRSEEKIEYYKDLYKKTLKIINKKS